MDLLSNSVEKLEMVKLNKEEGTELSKEVVDALVEHSKRGNAAAQFTLAQYYLTNNDATSSLGLFKQSAALGYSQAQYQLAVMYYEGISVETDPQRGFRLMLQISQSKERENHNIIPAAQFNVGKAYYQGFGVLQNDEEAARWWTLCASGTSSGSNVSSIRSMNTLALFHSRPENTDRQKAFYWHERAANLDHTDSMAAIGVIYFKGEGCKKSKENALRWLKKSADKGSVYGTGMLTHYYYSIKLYRNAIEIAQRLCELKETVDELVSKSGGLCGLIRKGLATAFYIYAQCLRCGQGINKNDPEAVVWYEKAKLTDEITVFELHKLMMQGRL